MLGDWRHFGDLLTRNARIDGKALGLSDGDLRFSWQQAEARTNRLAHGLRRLGIRQGERVAILAANRVPFVETLFACARLGVVAVPLNTMLQSHEVADLLADSGAVATFSDRRHAATAEAACGPTIRHRILYDDDPGSVGDGTVAYEELLAESGSGATPTAPVEAESPIQPDDLLILLYTSGTTGLPKGVMYSHWGALQGTLIHVLAIASHRRHRVMLPSPLYSAAGLAGIACAVAVGSACHVLRFSVEAALETLARERITFTNLVPTTLRLLLDHPQRPVHDLSSLEVLLYGGSPMPEDTLRRASESLGCDFRQTFATSETGLAGTVLEPEDHRSALQDPLGAHLLQSCGKPQVGVGVRILDEDWNEVPRGEPGDIAVACDANMLGYWKRPQATAEVLRGGWLKTGDVARQDAAGYFYLIDRKNDMIVTGALNVFPSEVERELLAHPGVRDCVVVGLPDPKWGEAVTAFVVPEDRDTAAPDAETLLEHCRPRLAAYKRPKAIHFIDQIPRNPAGKPLRRLLRQPVESSEENAPR